MSKQSSLASNFKVGDKVRVTRVAKNFEHGWGLVWLLDMNSAVGNTFTVKAVNKYSGCLLEFAEKGGPAWFPFTVLENLSAKKKKRTKNQRLSSVYRRAALFQLSSSLFDNKEMYSCLAVIEEARQQHRPSEYAEALYGEYFTPEGYSRYGSWWGSWAGEEGYVTNQNERCLALLFMSEIAKDL